MSDIRQPSQGLLGFIFTHAKKFLFVFVLSFFLSAIIAIERVYFPYLLGKIIDIINIIPEHNKYDWWNYLGPTILLVLLVMILMDVGFRLQELLLEYVMPRFKASIRMNAYSYTMKHSAKFFSDNHVGSVGAKINDLASFIGSIVNKILNVFAPIFGTIIAGVFTVCFINIKLGIIYGLWVATHICITVFTAQIIKKYYSNSAEKLNIVQGKIIDAINNILNIRLFNRVKQEIKYVNPYQKDEIDASYSAGIVGILIRSVLSIVTIVGLGLFLYFSIQAWASSQITVGNLTAVLTILVNSILMAWWLTYEFVLFFTDYGRTQNAYSIMGYSNNINQSAENVSLNVKNGQIEFKEVSFSYDESEFFNKQNILIQPKQKIGLVGHSGAGKTTFVNLILREYDLENGKILIDGQNINEVNLNSLHDNVAYITQEAMLFHRSIRENLLFAKPDATEEELINACKAAHCYELIQSMPDGFDHVVGERGSKLSGGQKQRLAIARGILKNAPIIFLDEATSALDSITEKSIQKALDNLCADKTTIIIAHRLSTIKNVDRILVFEKGKIIEDGTHAELIEKNGLYTKLYNHQIDIID